MTCFRFIATLNAFYTKQCRTEIKKPCFGARFFWFAPRAGFEPAANRLTADCSTTELSRNDVSQRTGCKNNIRPKKSKS
jgi:hypothetical protein